MPHTYVDHRKENEDGNAEIGDPLFITGHWPVTRSVTADCNHYNWAVDKDGEWHQMRPASGPGSLGSHTWHRNSRNIGVGVVGMDGSDINDVQIESTARGVAELMGIYAIPIENVHDHVFWAIQDNYGPGSGDPQTKVDFTGTVAGKRVWKAIMSKIPWYRQQLVSGKLANLLAGKIK